MYLRPNNSSDSFNRRFSSNNPFRQASPLLGSPAPPLQRGASVQLSNSAFDDWIEKNRSLIEDSEEDDLYQRPSFPTATRHGSDTDVNYRRYVNFIYSLFCLLDFHFYLFLFFFHDCSLSFNFLYWEFQSQFRWRNRLKPKVFSPASGADENDGCNLTAYRIRKAHCEALMSQLTCHHSLSLGARVFLARTMGHTIPALAIVAVPD